MKVLAVIPFCPVPADFGGALRVFHILKQLAVRADVDVLGYGTKIEEESLRAAIPQLKRVQFIEHPWVARNRRAGQLLSTITTHSFFHLSVVSAAMQRLIEQTLANAKYDVVHTEFSHLGPFRIPPGPRRVLDTHNVEYDNFRRMYETTKTPIRKWHYYLEYKKQKADELAWCRMQDAVLTTSERDAQLFGEDLQNTPRFVVPNGVDAAYFQPNSDVQVEANALVFTGMMAYVPNYDGMGWFLDDVFPLILQRKPNTKIYIVGKNPPPQIVARASDQIIVTGTVPDVRPYVWRSSVYVVPLRMGGGTRLKIAEALAMKKPMVTTAVGCEGIDLVNDSSALIANAPEAFASSVVRLLDDAALRQRLVDAGYALMQRKYEWSVIGDTLEKIYKGLSLSV